MFCLKELNYIYGRKTLRLVVYSPPFFLSFAVILVGLPTLSRALQIGISYNYSLVGKSADEHSISLNYSVYVFARYNF
jgi:hypothetical protein